MTENEKLLSAALAEILDAMLAAEEGKPRRASPSPDFLTLEEIEDETKHYLRSPIATALRAGVRDFGRIIAKTMNCDQMLELLELSVGEEDGYLRTRHISIVDHCWDGLVDVNGLMWAC